MNDLQISFEHIVRKQRMYINLDKDANEEYIDRKTQTAYFWFCKGWIQGEKG